MGKLFVKAFLKFQSCIIVTILFLNRYKWGLFAVFCCQFKKIVLCTEVMESQFMQGTNLIGGSLLFPTKLFTNNETRFVFS
jgi:hypothetical protein